MRVLIPVFSCALLGACSADESAAPTDPLHSEPPAVSEGRYGLVVLSHDQQTPGVAVSAQLMAWQGDTRAGALHALSVPEEAWLLESAPAAGQCRGVDSGHSVDGVAAWIDLLGAGVLTVRAPDPIGDAQLVIQPQAFPPVLFALRGLVYDADGPQDLPFLAGGAYRVHAPGDEVGELLAEVVAPAAVRITDLDPVVEGLAVRWTGEPTARVILSRDVGSRTVGVLCNGVDGEALVPEEELNRLGPGPAQVVVARAHRISTTVSGLDETDVLFVSRDAAEVRLRR